MNTLLTLSLFVGGFTASAEAGSVAFVHLVLRKLPPQQHVQAEQGLLQTFGRAMPVLMPARTLLAGLLAWKNTDEQAQPWLAAAAFSSLAGLVSTVIYNVPINQATGTWDADQPPADWKATRNRWEVAQAVRASLFLLSFGLTCVAATRSR